MTIKNQKFFSKGRHHSLKNITPSPQMPNRYILPFSGSQQGINSNGPASVYPNLRGNVETVEDRKNALAERLASLKAQHGPD